jgi:uncharacterized protein
MHLNDLMKSGREEILNIAAKHGACNARVFGSAARGEADSYSDIEYRRSSSEALGSML